MQHLKPPITEALIKESESLIKALAYKTGKYLPSCLEDLYQEGIIGLIKAYHNFDATRGTPFLAYASAYILGEMKEYRRKLKGLKVGRELLYLCSKIERARDLVCQFLKRNPTTLELANYLEMDEAQLIEALGIKMFIKSIDEALNDEGGLTLKDVLFKEEVIDYNTLIWLEDELNNLTIEEKRLLELRYLEDKTQQQTAVELGINQVQVSRYEQKALLKLRNKMNH